MRKLVFLTPFMLILSLAVSGCAADYEVALGSSVAKMRTEQTLNPEATQENMGYIPTGSGERMQATLDVYHKQTASMKNDTSMSADNVLNIPVSSGK
ncbi:hypothetical protein [Vibrio sp. HN007]|uniref:hypothetical protein n=1 Tax=Vibrio iocasae TaxID=3098914 RepID=UPI0035D3ED98